MLYLYSFFLYLCVDLCHRFYETPYNFHSQSGTNIRKHNLVNSSPNICNDCLYKWDTSPIGNSSGYTKFFIFTRESSSNYTEIIFLDNKSLAESGFNNSKSTKLLIHGWHDGAFKHFAPRLKNKYLGAQDINVIAVDWSSIAKLTYPFARVAVQPVGIRIAQFIDWLIRQANVSLDSIHVVGHSLGAHIGGVVGEYLRTGRLSRITGLDPAGPGFTFGIEGRLDSSDALFVDVIHTSGWWAGYYDAIGTVDFYPNGGFPDQPGCHADLGTCSHIRSYKLFMESVTSVGFIAQSCRNWFDFTKGQCGSAVAVMGEHVDFRSRGRFYLYTAAEPPYALGNYSTVMPPKHIRKN